MTARRLLLVAAAGIALLSAASVSLIHSWTSERPSTAVAPPVSADVTPSSTVTPPPGSAPAAPPAVPGGVWPPASSTPGPGRAQGPLPPAGPRGTAKQVQVLGAKLDRLKISFKLDPRLTQGLHMGDRWVSPAIFTTTGTGGLVSVPARASGVDAEGRSFKSPTWWPAEPDMVAVTPGQGAQVEITVLRPGESRLTVGEHGATRILMVKAVEREGGFWQVDISQ